MKQYGVRVNGVLIRKSFTRATEARRWQQSQKLIQDEIRSGTNKHLQPILLNIHAVDFLNSRKDQTSHQHQVTWMGKYILMRRRFRDKFLHEITKGMWKEVFGKNGELIQFYKLAPATHNHIRAMVHKMYEDARREYEPPRAIENPVHDIPELPIPKKKIQILGTKEDIRKYVIAAYEDELACWGIYSAIKLNTGLRQQNIIPLRWKDWEPAHGYLHIREKYTRKGFKPGSKSDGDERTSPVNRALTMALEHWKNITRFSRPEDFIVWSPSGQHLTVHRIWDAHDRTLKRAGLSYMSEHKLRHTYATHYLAAGGSIHDLKLNLFHSTITTTEVYSHALESELSRRGSAFQMEVPSVKRELN